MRPELAGPSSTFETLDTTKAFTRLNRLYDSGRLQQAVGQERCSTDHPTCRRCFFATAENPRPTEGAEDCRQGREVRRRRCGCLRRNQRHEGSVGSAWRPAPTRGMRIRRLYRLPRPNTPFKPFSPIKPTSNLPNPVRHSLHMPTSPLHRALAYTFSSSRL